MLKNNREIILPILYEKSKENEMYLIGRMEKHSAVDQNLLNEEETKQVEV